MKHLTFLTLFLTTHLMANAAPVEVALKGAIVPSGYNAQKEFIGYDNNDPEVLFTVAGVLSNTCERVGPFTHKITDTDVKIFQTAYEYKGKSKVCIQTKVPFFNHIKIPGIQKENLNYKIVDGHSGKEIGKLPIGLSPVSEPDSELYLTVMDARLWYDSKAPNGKWRVVVVGKYNPDCTKLKTMHVDVLENERAIVVRPVLQRDEKVADADCEPTERIQHSEPIDVDLKGLWLLHVRSVQGAGKHEIIDTDSYRQP